MNSTIRRLTENDLEIWKEIRLEALEKHPLSFTMSYEEEALYSDKKWLERLADNHIFGAFEQDRIVACGAFYVSKPKKISHRATFWGMYVKPEQRGFGIGRKIVDTIIVNSYRKFIKMRATALLLRSCWQ